jgi:FkbM family methyltransferase
VWAAYRASRPLPPFRVRGGPTITGGPDADLVGIVHEIFVARCYTRGFYRPQPGDVVLDLGANIGMFALFVNWLCPGVRVHSFEPMPPTRERLEANVRANNLGDRVTVHPVAVSDRIGTLTLHLGGTAGHSSVVASAFAGGREVAVPCIDLAAAFDRAGPRVALLKIDTEGAEVDILAGVRPGALDRVERVVVEYHGLFRPGSREAVAGSLQAAGFTRIEDRPDLPDGQLGLIRGSRR